MNPSTTRARLAGALLLAFSLAAVAGDRSVGEHIDDSTIAVTMKAALVDSSKASASHLNVDVAKGVVLLAGFVDSETEHQAALGAVDYVRGVQRVIDGMVVLPGKRSFGRTVDDTAIQTRLKARLASMEGAGKALAINTEVRMGQVILSGFLDSQELIDRAGAIAKDVPGVTTVHNKLALSN